MKNFNIDFQNQRETERVIAALSCKTRQEILRLLQKDNFSVWQIAETLKTPVSTISTHLKVLSNAGLISLKVKPNARGGEKLVIREFDSIIFKTPKLNDDVNINMHTIKIPIGGFSNVQISDRCGMASENGFLIPSDMPEAFCSPNRYRAQLIWFTSGYIEYKIPIYELLNKDIVSVDFSMELCSEIAKYNNDWQSDITFWLDDIELCTFTSPGDFGGRRGVYTPAWWGDDSTQYGIIKHVKVDSNGTYLDEVRVGNIAISHLDLKFKKFLTFRIGIKDNADNVGGINLFGSKFGDYAQHIIVNVASGGEDS